MNTKLLKKLRKKFAKQYYYTPSSSELNKSKIWYGNHKGNYYGGKDKEYNEKFIADLIRKDMRNWIDKHYPRRHKVYYYPW